MCKLVEKQDTYYWGIKEDLIDISRQWKREDSKLSEKKLDWNNIDIKYIQQNN